MIPRKKVCVLVNSLRELDLYERILQVMDTDLYTVVLNETMPHEHLEKAYVILLKRNIWCINLNDAFKLSPFSVLLTTNDVLRKSEKSGVKYIKQRFNISSFDKLLNKLVFWPKQKYNAKKKYKSLSNRRVFFPRGADLKSNHPNEMAVNFFTDYFCISQIERRSIENACQNRKKNYQLWRIYDPTITLIGMPRFDEPQYINTNLVIVDTNNNDNRDKRSRGVWFGSQHSYDKSGQRVQDWASLFLASHASYFVAFRPHPRTVECNITLIDNIRSSGFVVIEDPAENIANLHRRFDVVFAEWGGSIFDGIYLDRRCVFLRHPDLAGSTANEDLISLLNSSLPTIGIDKNEENISVIRSIVDASFDWEPWDAKRKTLREQLFGDIEKRRDGAVIICETLKKFINVS